MKPVEMLRKGLAKLRRQISDRKTSLEAALKASQPVSEADQDWLDNEGNLIDEECVVDLLDHASDFERGLERLNSHEQSLVENLRLLAGDKTPSKKRKCMNFFNFKFCANPGPFSGPELNPSSQSEQKDIVKPLRTGPGRENATLIQQIEILDWHHANGNNQSKTVQHFNQIYPNLRLKQPKISDWCKHEEKLRNEYAHSTDAARSAKRICQTQHPEITEMLDLWVSKAMTDGILLTGEVLRQKWQQFADLACIPNDERLSLSDGWLSRYKSRTKLKQLKRHGEAASVTSTSVEKEWHRLQELIEKSGYQLRDIFNTDETALFYACVYHSIL
jgi:hypothetical protein